MTDVDLRQALQDLRPWLNYDRDEGFFADAAEVLIGNAFGDGPLKPYATRLLRAGGDEEIASAVHDDPDRRLTLDFLRPGEYPTGETARDDDYLDPGPEWVADARRAHAQPDHANRIYGRVVPARGGGHWLQYWFFYFGNVKGIPSVRSATGPLAVGLHAGDWEMIQLYLPPGHATPAYATYAAHTYAYKVESAISGWKDGVPEVYVGVGSHASYPQAGSWRNLSATGSQFLKKLDDRCVPGGTRVRPDLIVLEDEELPGWCKWPGRWGLGAGPRSPACQPQWKHPDRLHDEAKRVDEGLRDWSGLETADEAPQPVTVHMADTHRRVMISFDVPAGFEDDWAALLTVAINTRDDELPLQFVYDVTTPGEHRPISD